jgi:hypothetical protein
MGIDQLGLWIYLPPAPQEPEYNEFRLVNDNLRLIEADRCFIKDGRIRSGRFWYATRFVEGGEWQSQPPEFIGWAETVFRKTKTLLKYHDCRIHGHKSKARFGETAWKHYANGAITPI